MAEYQVEAVVIGAGVVGLAIARQLARRGLEVLVVEQAAAIGTETSSRNSEVIHAGIYYAPGTHKARLCVLGKQMLYEYLQTHQLDYRRCGKLIVATCEAELTQLQRIEDRARRAGVYDLVRLTQAQVEAHEPSVRAVAGLLSPSTGIIDSHQYMLQLQADIEASGGLVALNTSVASGQQLAQDGFELRLGDSAEQPLGCRYLVNAAGLHARSVLLGLHGLAEQAQVPAQHYAIGHYYSYPGTAPFARLVYPTPSPGGLGVHATIDLAGQVRFGPDVRWLEQIDYQFDDSHRAGFAEAIRAYYPGLDARRLQPGYTGIRPKLTGPGEPGADFCFATQAQHGMPGLVSLHGIESPGLTASLAIAAQVEQLLLPGERS